MQQHISNTTQDDDIVSITFSTSESRVLVDTRPLTKVAVARAVAEEWDVVDGVDVVDNTRTSAKPESVEEKEVKSSDDQKEAKSDDDIDAPQPTSFVFVPSSLEARKSRTPSRTLSDDNNSTNSPTDIDTLSAQFAFQLAQEEQRARLNLVAEEKRLFNESSSAFMEEFDNIRVREQIAGDEAMAKELERRATERYEAAKEIALAEAATPTPTPTPTPNVDHSTKQQQSAKKNNNNTTRKESKEAVAAAQPAPVAVASGVSNTVNRPCDCLGATSGIHRPSCSLHAQKTSMIDKLFA